MSECKECDGTGIAPLPAAPAPTESEAFRAHLQSASDKVATWPSWKRTSGAAPTELTGELPPLPEPEATYADLDDFGNVVSRKTNHFTADQMHQQRQEGRRDMHETNITLVGENCKLSEKLNAMRSAFHQNMLRAFPDKAHAEIDAEITRATGVAARQAPAGVAKELTPDAILAARAEGRAEALEILTGLDPENGIDEYIGWSTPVSSEDEGSAYWEVESLRELLGADDKLHNLFDRAESMYWEASAKSDEADRMMLTVKRAPYYKPLHDFLAKHEAWGLMADLKQAAETDVAPDAGIDARDGEQTIATGYESGFLATDPTQLGATIHLHYQSPAEAENAFDALSKLIDAALAQEKAK